MLLVLAVVSISFLSESYADDIIVDFDKAEYDTGETLVLSGAILEFSMPIVAISIYDPDGQILSANNLELDEEGNFSKILSLDSPFYDKPGTYTVKINYRQTTIEETFVISGEVASPEPILNDILKPEIILLSTNKDIYTDGDTVTITGLVSSRDSPTVLIGIYDTFGTPSGFYFGDINENLEFSTSFLVKAGVNFKVDGIYSVKAHYAESEATTNFEFFEKLSGPSDNDTTKQSDNDTTKQSDNDTTKQSDNDTTKQSDNDTTKQSDNDTTKQSDNDTTKQSDNDTTKQSDNDTTKQSDNDTTKQSDNDTTKQSDNDTTKQSDNDTTKQSDNTPKIIPKESSSSVKENKIESSDSSQTTPKGRTNNLTVEDIELGKMLNQINLECDRSKYADTISYYDGMGPALYRLCKFENSVQSFSSSLVNDPNNVEILSNKGSALGKLGYYEEAISHFDRAIEINPDFLPAINNKANALANIGKHEEAISLYAKVLGKNPNYSVARLNMEITLSEFTIKNKESFSNTQKSVDVISSPEKISKQEIPISVVKENPKDIFEQIESVFSSFGTLLGILN